MKHSIYVYSSYVKWKNPANISEKKISNNNCTYFKWTFKNWIKFFYYLIITKKKKSLNKRPVLQNLAALNYFHWMSLPRCSWLPEMIQSVKVVLWAVIVLEWWKLSCTKVAKGYPVRNISLCISLVLTKKYPCTGNRWVVSDCQVKEELHWRKDKFYLWATLLTPPLQLVYSW